MQPEEIDISLDELENRLDRLRSLYEQYFLGIEKIEPGVARKDVDRRFWLLRRVQIRNTARRFRLQVLIQRYNTFQQYWARICREIENGTYTRHLVKAQQRLGEEPKTWAAKKRLGYFRRRPEGESEGDAPEAHSDRNGADADGSDLGALLDGGVDLAAEAAKAAEAALAGADRRVPVAIERPAAPQSVRPAAPQRDATLSGREPSARSRSSLETLDLDLDDELAPSPAARPEPRPAPRQPDAAAASRVSPPLDPKRVPALDLPRAPRPGAPTAAAAAAPVRRAEHGPGASPGAPAAAAAAAPGSVPPIARPLAPERAAAPMVRTPPSPNLSGQAKPAVPRPEPAQGLSPRLVTQEGAKGPAASRLPLPKPAAAIAPKPAQSTAESSGLSEARLQQIHAELAEAKRRLNQSDSVSLDALTRSLRESEKRIRAQHPGRAVDFHVVLKDGKPIVKPIVRK